MKHKDGSDCLPYKILKDHFGDAKLSDGTPKADYLLWEYTCFPMSDELAVEQAKEIVEAHKQGKLKEYLHHEQMKMENYETE